MRVRRNLLCAVALLVLGSMSQVASACVATYTDSFVDAGQSEVHAWAWVEDTFNTGYCFQAAFAQWGAWEHTYHASVQIESPTQNSVSDVGGQSNVSFGGGSASAFAAISFVGDPGEYEIDWVLWILCTVGGLFFHVSDSGSEQVEPPPDPCSDPEVASMVQEYVTRGIHNLGNRPSVDCSRFRGPVNSQYFQWNYELNGASPERHDNWAWLEDAFLDALDGTRVTYGYPIQGTGAYRCPNKNDMVGSTQPLSWHQYGRAADVVNHSSRPRTGAEWENIAIAAEQNGAVAVIELVNNDINHPQSHVHLQWPNIPW